MLGTYEKVKRGMALLDRIQPGWQDRIDLQTLRISHPLVCVLGQLYGEFDGATRDIWGSDDAAYRLAMAQSHGFDRSVGSEYAELTDVWQLAIMMRRATPVEQVEELRELVSA